MENSKVTAATDSKGDRFIISFCKGILTLISVGGILNQVYGSLPFMIYTVFALMVISDIIDFAKKLSSKRSYTKHLVPEFNTGKNMKKSNNVLMIFPFSKKHINMLSIAFIMLLMFSLVLFDSGRASKDNTIVKPIEKSEFETTRLESAQKEANDAIVEVKTDYTFGTLFFLSSIYCLTNIIIINKKVIA